MIVDTAALFPSGTRIEVCATTGSNPAEMVARWQPGGRLLAIFEVGVRSSGSPIRRCIEAVAEGGFLEFQSVDGKWIVTIARLRR